MANKTKTALSIDRKIHIAGPLIGSVQRCMRCHARIDSNRKWPERQPSGWKEGVSIAWDRRGASAIDETNAERFVGVRPCGRNARKAERK